MTKLLREEVGTRYLINSLRYLLIDKLQEYIKSGEDITVDLAGVKFGPDSARELVMYYDKLEFINSEEPELDALLKKNRYITLNPEEEWPELDMSMFTKENWQELIHDVPAGKYKVKLDASDVARRCILIFLIMARPDIDFDLTDCLMDIARIITTHVFVSSFNDEEAYLVEPPYVSRVKISDLSYNDNMVIPVSFGRDRIVSFRDPIKRVPGYENLIDYVSEWIDKLFYTEEVEETVDITEFLQMRD